MTRRRHPSTTGKLLTACATVVVLLLLIAIGSGDGTPDPPGSGTPTAAPTEAPRMNSFDQLDQDRNRLIERREAQRQPGLNSRFATLDRNGDRGLDRSEFDGFEHGADRVPSEGQGR